MKSTGKAINLIDDPSNDVFTKLYSERNIY